MRKLLINRVLGVVICLIFICGTAFSKDRYVSPPGGYGTNDTDGGYTNWLGAATQIQWAVNKAENGETVRVTNGTYYLTNQISITKSITVRGVNGRDVTIVNGNYPLYTNRCLYITGKATVDGLTIFNGFVVTNSPSGTVGGGVLMGYVTGTSSSGTVQNCTIIGNTVSNASAAASGRGGGINVDGEGYIYNCIICSNTVDSQYGSWSEGGGGVNLEYPYGGVISNCVLFTNKMYRSSITGTWTHAGGAIFNVYGTVINCTVYSNFSQGRGGGIYSLYGCVRNCSIYKNSSPFDAGGGIETTSATTDNCLVYGNIGLNAARIDSASVMRNCTIVGNSGVGIQTYSTTVGPRFENTISYYNGGVDINRGAPHPIFTNCCAGSSSADALTNGSGNITTEPMFVNTNISNYRLANNSPCFNRGANREWMTNAVDLDGRVRIRYGIVDMGAYERIHAGTIYRSH